MWADLASESKLRMIMLGFAGLCLVFGFLRGLGRLLLLGLSLVAGSMAAVGWLRYVPAFCVRWMGEIPLWFAHYGAAVVGVATLWFVRRFLHALVSGSGSAPAMDGRQRLRGGIFSLVPALFLLWGGAIALRWTGAASQLRTVEAAARAHDASRLAEVDLLGRFHHTLTRGALGAALNRLDPFAAHEAATLGCLLALSHNPEAWQRLGQHPAGGAIVRTDAFRRLRNDNEVLHALSFSNYSQLLALPEMDAALNDKPLRDAALALDLPGALRFAISGVMESDAPRAEVIAE
jgi:hypothetical protein